MQQAPARASDQKEMPINFGVFTMFNTREGRPHVEAFREWLGLAQLADEMGMDTFWLGESHFRPHRAVLTSPLVGACAVASRTRRMRVGLAVQVLPLANPLRVAEEAALVDHISEGRLIFGVGRSSFIESYEGYGVDYEESRALFFDSLEIIQQAWRDESLTYAGRYYQFHKVDVVPKPYQRPQPPIRVAVASRGTFPLIGKLGFSIFIRHQMEIAELRELLAQYQEERHAAAFLGSNDVILQISAYVAETADKAHLEPEASTMRQGRLLRDSLQRTGNQEALERLSRLSNVTYDDVLTRVAYGTPEAVTERIQEYRESLGITGGVAGHEPRGTDPL